LGRGKDRMDEARSLFLKHFPDHEMMLLEHAEYDFSFRPITGESKLDDVERLVQRLEVFYSDLRKLHTTG